MPVSFNPKDAVKGGLLNDIDAVLKRIRVQTNIYQNGTPSVGLVGVLVLDGGDEERAVWSLGKPEEWELVNPTHVDGPEGSEGYDEATQVESAKRHTGVHDSSNVQFMIRELIAAGFPENKIDNDVSIMDGVKCHWIRKVPPARPGLASNQADDKFGPKTVLVPEKVLLMPGEKARGGARTTTAKASTTAATTTNKASNVATLPADDLANEPATTVAAAAIPHLQRLKGGRTIAAKDYGLATLAALSATDEFKSSKDEGLKDAVKRLLKNADFITNFDGFTVASDGAVTIPASA